MNILIKNGKLVTESETLKKDLLVEGEKIKVVKNAINESQLSEYVKVIDATGKFIFPGLIDAHTHYQLVSRGTVTADKFYDGSILAAFGGVTTVIDFSDHLSGKRIVDGAIYRNKEAAGEMAIEYRNSGDGGTASAYLYEWCCQGQVFD